MLLHGPDGETPTLGSAVGAGVGDGVADTTTLAVGVGVATTVEVAGGIEVAGGEGMVPVEGVDETRAQPARSATTASVAAWRRMDAACGW